MELDVILLTSIKAPILRVEVEQKRSTSGTRREIIDGPNRTIF